MVLVPTVRGYSGHGKHFAALARGQRREAAAKDVVALIGWLGSQPFLPSTSLDLSRISLVGVGYGGYLAAAATAILARTDGSTTRPGLAKLVLDRPVSNLATFAMETAVRLDLPRSLLKALYPHGSLTTTASMRTESGDSVCATGLLTASNASGAWRLWRR